MKQKKTRLRHYTPDVQGKLLLTMAGITLLTMGLVYLLITYGLEPQYHRTIQSRLESKVSAITDMINTYEGPISERRFGILMLDGAFWTQLGEAFNSGDINVDGCCVDISDATMRSIQYKENLYPCILHGSTGAFGGDFGYNANTPLVVRLRHQLFSDGKMYEVIESGGNSQMLVGSLSKDGTYAVIVSTSLAQIATGADVLRELLLPIALLLLLLDLFFALWFSRWFTKPIRQLSDGARQIAAGHYDVRVPVDRHDEMGLLAEEFNHMASEVARSAQLEKDILANVSHDLRTPLTLIKGYAETVRDITGDDAERRAEQCNIIVDETDRLSSLVNSVMELSKVSSGAEKIVPVEFDMSQLCFEVAGRYDALCAQNGWRLELQADAECTVCADPAMMERVLHNLLGNAFHHIGPDGVVVLRAIPATHGCRVEVIDHGPGIQPEDLPHLFDRYYRARRDRGRNGTGLGLSITKAILQQHGFAFGVESAPGMGSTFWFEMTRTPPAP